MAKQESVKVKVKLSKAAIIAGKDFEKGSEVTVTEAQAKTLKEHGFTEGEATNV